MLDGGGSQQISWQTTLKGFKDHPGYPSQYYEPDAIVAEAHPKGH